jgi:formylglycine-generating enzyme required for sulfatase activity
MHGNVWEWTRSAYRPYPYLDNDGRNDTPAAPALSSPRRTVRGGSWYTRPAEARSAARLAYPAWQRVYDVGFRVVCPE